MMDLDVCKCAITILIGTKKHDLSKLSASITDAEASLLSRLSGINSDIEQITNLQRQSINEQYIDFLIAKIHQIKSQTIEYTVPIHKLLKEAGEISTGVDIEDMGMDIDYISKKMKSILDEDIEISQSLRPLIDSRVNDLKSLLMEEVDILKRDSDRIRKQIMDCEIFHEAIRLTEYIYTTEIGEVDGIPAILENDYKYILQRVQFRYREWKEMVR